MNFRAKRYIVKAKEFSLDLLKMTIGTLIMAILGLQEPEVVQIAATRTRLAGRYHLMDAQNPVWIVSGEGRG